jgi:hypothetical protein
MNEGWYEGEYLMIFSQAEAVAAQARYNLVAYLPGYSLVGLRGWDDVIVINPVGIMCSLPTVPLEAQEAVPFELPAPLPLEADARFAGKIKWYVKPLVFGGDARDEGNTIWVTHEEHAELVSWWNEQHKGINASGAGA